jgi:hypothetical protein
MTGRESYEQNRWQRGCVPRFSSHDGMSARRPCSSSHLKIDVEKSGVASPQKRR